MFGTKGSYENYLDRQERWLDENETITCIGPIQECAVEGYPVRYINGLYNFWAWVSPISPFTQHIRQKGGYYAKQRSIT
jgi:hypothetical protein